jgi:hypothetical protein
MKDARGRRRRGASTWWGVVIDRSHVSSGLTTINLFGAAQNKACLPNWSPRKLECRPMTQGSPLVSPDSGALG